MFFDGVPSSMYTIEAVLPRNRAADRHLAALDRDRLSRRNRSDLEVAVSICHVPSKFGLSCADSPAMSEIARAAKRIARFMFITPSTTWSC